MPIESNRRLALSSAIYNAKNWKLGLFLALCGLVVATVRVVVGRDIFRSGRTTDATFFRGARLQRRGWWADLPGAARAGIRFAVVAALVLAYYTPTVVGSAAVVGLGVVGWRLWVRHRARKHERDVLRPVWPAVAGIIGVPEDEPPTRWLDIPHAVTDDPTSSLNDIVVLLRAADADDERRVDHLVRLFDQRFDRAHIGVVDYARRLVHIRVRPPEPDE